MPDLRDTIAIRGPMPAESAPAAPVPQTPTPASPESAPPGWILIGAPLLGYVVLFLLSFAIGIAFAFAYAPTPGQVAGMLRAFMDDYALLQLANAVLYALIFLMIWALLPKSGAAALSSWFRRVGRGTIVFAAATGLALAAVLFWGQIWLVTHNITQFHATAGEKSLVPPSPIDLVPGLIFIAVIVPIVEETYFRGLVLKWLQSRVYTVLAVPLSAVLFAATHGKFLSHDVLEGWILTGFLAFVGLVSAIWALATRSLWPSVVIHGSYNGAVIAVPLVIAWLNL
jgi:membrane protease YdiL (CAAX protease family)